MNKKAVENISEMNRQMKKLKKSPPTNRKRKVEMDMPSPLTPLNLVMENNRFNQYTEIKQMPSRNMVYPSTMVMNSSEGPEPPGLFDQGLLFDDSHSVERSP